VRPMEIKLPYGEGEIELDIGREERLTVRSVGRFEVREEEEGIVRSAMEDPLGKAPLAEEVEELPPEAEVALVITDKTRACPDQLIVPLLVEDLLQGGLRADQLTVIAATGLHERPSPEEVRELAGGERIPAQVKTLGHDANSSPTARVAHAAQGYPIEINQAVLEADYVITTGFIEPHFFAGFSGGRKSILPGVAGAETIMANHGYANIDHPRAAAGLLEGNPIHEGAVEAARSVGVDFVVNVLLNKEGRIVAARAGELERAFQAGVLKAIEICGLKFEEKFDLVVTTNSGHPLDQNLYQTVKGVYTASLVTKEGGKIAVAAKCGAGLGPDNFYQLSRQREGPPEVLRYIEENEPLEAQWENQVLCNVLQDHPVHLLSDLAAGQVEEMMISPLAGPPQLGKLIEEEEGRVLVLPEGPFTLPYFSGSPIEEEIERIKDEVAA